MARTAAESLQARGRTLRTEILLQLQAAEFDYDKALQLLDAAPNKDLLYPLLVNRGLLWLERREWDKAVAELQAAIHLDDRQWLAFENLGLVYQQQKNLDQAIEQFTRAIERRPDRAPLFRFRAGVNLDRKEATAAERDPRWPTWTRPSGSSRKRVPCWPRTTPGGPGCCIWKGERKTHWPRARRP